MSVRRLCVFIIFAGTAFAQHNEGPQPTPVNPGDATHPPSDAVVLFDGKDLNAWTTEKGTPSKCKIEAGAVMACTSGAGNIVSKEKFQDAQIHLEFKVPNMPDEHGQLRGNSGVYLQGHYEIQILDSYHNPTYANGVLGALYGQAPPLVNAARPPDTWEMYDIVFHGPRCGGDGAVTDHGVVTVLLNGVLEQDHVPIQNTSGGCAPGPLQLQDHSGFKGAPVTTMRFRNIWLRHLHERPQA